MIRTDLKLSKGKMAAQAAHASISSYRAAKREYRKAWLREGQKKVVLKVGSEKEIYELKEKAEKMKLPFAIVRDAGLTEIPAGTVTAIGIGPAREEDIDKVTGKLDLL